MHKPTIEELREEWRQHRRAARRDDGRLRHMPADEAVIRNGVGDCLRCDARRMAEELAKGECPQMGFIVCPECGNKRCPKATDHRLSCTGSNEPGQPGSAYGGLKRDAD